MPETLKIQDKMNVHLICPTEELVNAVADKILLPASQGNVMILKNRAPFFAYLVPGPMWVYNVGEIPKCYIISKGVVEFRRNICSVLAWGLDVDKIDTDRAQKDLNETQRELDAALGETAREVLKDRIDYLNAVINGLRGIPTPDFK